MFLRDRAEEREMHSLGCQTQMFFSCLIEIDIATEIEMAFSLVLPAWLESERDRQRWHTHYSHGHEAAATLRVLSRVMTGSGLCHTPTESRNCSSPSQGTDTDTPMHSRPSSGSQEHRNNRETEGFLSIM